MRACIRKYWYVRTYVINRNYIHINSRLRYIKSINLSQGFWYDLFSLTPYQLWAPREAATESMGMGKQKSPIEDRIAQDAEWRRALENGHL